MKELPAPAANTSKSPLEIARDVLAKMGGTERQVEEAEEMLKNQKKLLAELQTLFDKPEYQGALSELVELLRKKHKEGTGLPSAFPGGE
jgi:hypothetical protein